MNFITRLLGIPLGYVMYWIYKFIPNYGIALLVFTVLTRLLMFPMTIRQQKSTAKMSLMQPRIQEIQKKYKDDQQRMNEEMQKLYDDEGFNPMSGCMPMLIQFPILMGLIDVIYRPLTHIIRLPSAVISKAIKLVNLMGVPAISNIAELEVIKIARQNPMFFGMLGASSLSAINELDYTFLGINLMETPTSSMFTDIFRGSFNPVIIIPILSGLTSLLLSIYTQKTTAVTAAPDAQDASAGMMKSMMIFMPIMSLMIAMSVPAGVGLYWVYSNVVGVLQNMYVNKFHNPLELQEKMKEEAKAKKEEQRQERMEAKRQLKAGLLGEEHAEKAMTDKEIDRIRLQQARERDAKKYGEYVPEDEDVTDKSK